MRHLTGIDSLTPETVTDILDRADALIAAGRQARTILDGKIVLTMFFEPSTRTRTSFEIAALRLGARLVNWDPETSSLTKGESFADTIATLDAMGPDAVIIRHKDYGAPEYVANNMRCPVVNAGDSYREHPTQALLDALTLRQRFGRLDGLTIAICGDVAHSRVASSNFRLLRMMGANLRVVAPPALLPSGTAAEGIAIFDTMEAALPGCDAVMMLRLQKERMTDGLIGSDAEFFNRFGLTQERLTLASRDAVVLHPGPMNRGVEIADDVADDPHRSLILKQVANGVPVRMAVLAHLLT